MEAETFLCFGPDELPEARNRGYRLFGPPARLSVGLQRRR